MSFKDRLLCWPLANFETIWNKIFWEILWDMESIHPNKFSFLDEMIYILWLNYKQKYVNNWSFIFPRKRFEHKWRDFENFSGIAPNNCCYKKNWSTFLRYFIDAMNVYHMLFKMTHQLTFKIMHSFLINNLNYINSNALKITLFSQ